jgi:hypothetical protein
MEERERRIGENESLYRSINERIEDLNETFGLLTESMTVVCECGFLECAEQIELPIPEYERVRADPTQFVIRPGHEIPDVESVLEQHDEWFLIRKDKGEPAELARELAER